MNRDELNKLCDCRKPAVYKYKTVEGYRCWRCNFCGRSEFFNKDEERKVQESLSKEEE